MVLRSLLQQAGVDQRVHIAMHGLDVAADPARDLADRQGPLAGHGLESQQGCEGSQGVSLAAAGLCGWLCGRYPGKGGRVGNVIKGIPILNL